eukprot:RCo055473
MAVARGLRYLAVLVATLLAALQLVSLRLQRNQQEAENSALVLEVTHLRKLLREAQGRALEERPRASPSPAPFTASLGQPWVVRDSVNGTVSHSKVGDGARRASSGIDLPLVVVWNGLPRHLFQTDFAPLFNFVAWVRSSGRARVLLLNCNATMECHQFPRAGETEEENERIAWRRRAAKTHITSEMNFLHSLSFCSP